MRWVLLLLGLMPLGSTAQEITVKTALDDTAYALRRFDDVTSRIDMDRWQVPSDTLQQLRLGLRVTRSEVRDAKTILNRVTPTTVSRIDLLDLMQDLTQAEAELSELSSNILSFQDANTEDVTKASDSSGLAVEVMRASADASNAETKVFVVLKERLIADALGCPKPHSASAK